MATACSIVLLTFAGSFCFEFVRTGLGCAIYCHLKFIEEKLQPTNFEVLKEFFYVKTSKIEVLAVNFSETLRLNCSEFVLKLRDVGNLEIHRKTI